MLHRRKLPKPRKGAWFIPLDWSYLPASWQGWLTYIPFIAYLAATFFIIDAGASSLASTLFAVLPYWVSGVVIMHWLASHKS